MIEFEKTEDIKTWLGAGSVNFFGIPFAGKDNQAQRLAERVNGTVLSSGDIFRNSIVPPETKALIDRGELAPTQDFIEIVLPYLKKSDFAGHPLMLSSVGRWHGEEEGVISALKASKHPLRAAIYLALDESIAFERLERSGEFQDRGTRADDSEESLKRRIEEFRTKTMPVIDFYRDIDVLIEIDASLPKEDVERLILEQLAQRADKWLVAL